MHQKARGGGGDDEAADRPGVGHEELQLQALQQAGGGVGAVFGQHEAAQQHAGQQHEEGLAGGDAVDAVHEVVEVDPPGAQQHQGHDQAQGHEGGQQGVTGLGLGEGLGHAGQAPAGQQLPELFLQPGPGAARTGQAGEHHQ